MPSLERTASGTDLGLRSGRTILVRTLAAVSIVGGTGAVGIASGIAALSGALGFLGGVGTVVLGAVVPIAAIACAPILADRTLDRVLRGELERHMAKRARSMLSRVPTEELLCLRGRVKTTGAVAGLLSPAARCVLRQTWLMIGGDALVNEAGDDFTIIDDSGRMTPIFVADAALLPGPFRFRHCGPEEKRALTELVASSHLQRGPSLEKGRWVAGEAYVSSGDEVIVFGRRSQLVDPTVSERLSRDLPLRTAVGSAQGEPVLIIASRGGRLPRYLERLIGLRGGSKVPSA